MGLIQSSSIKTEPDTRLDAEIVFTPLIENTFLFFLPVTFCYCWVTSDFFLAPLIHFEILAAYNKNIKSSWPWITSSSFVPLISVSFYSLPKYVPDVSLSCNRNKRSAAFMGTAVSVSTAEEERAGEVAGLANSCVMSESVKHAGEGVSGD